MISVICCTIRDGMMENVFKNYEKQDVKKKELIIILNRDNMDLAKWKKRAKRSRNVSVYQFAKQKKLGDSLNFAIRSSKYDYIAKMDDDDYYAPQYLSEQWKALKKNKADVVCKRTVYMYFTKDKTLAVHLHGWRVNTFSNREGGIKGSTFLIRKRVYEKVKFPNFNKDEDMTFLRKCFIKKVKVFVADKNNYVCLRRSERLHTWNASNQSLLQESKILCKTKDYKKYLFNPS